MAYDEACRVLRVRLGASEVAVDAAWRKQIKRLHPDRNEGRKLNERAAIELNLARKVAVQMRPTHMRQREQMAAKTPRVVVDWESELR